MSRNVLVVYCHPLDDSFIAAARDRTLAGLAATDATVRFHDLYAEGFSPELTADEHRNHIQPGVAAELQTYADDLRWADTLVFVYPTWWSGQPAMLKGWIDRVFAAGVAWELPDGANRLVPKLRNVKRIVAVTSHGSSKLINSAQGEGGKRTLFRSVRAMCHPLARCHWIAFYGIDNRSDDERVTFLDRVERSITRIAR
ncbi:NAD(P)H-dependent oxidoreductase [Ilumatobacter coccineus]|jgi:NAD(P)H dehydrogenase (quinone)|uniref:Putative oxidoreductase n=1 Tax=Ilumatobacter coccineus (strain NBRC 103263 / KCTC 29153 / YM16-304) TaxID=1313172 RepID=A0A6C7E7C3_ILUCY|nr:NAD(P)H-dependent oxidoreductase [Ilumatobacter coccineus]BAN02637.1 putative oxidoreductase [Ilumatobacter coccineus YM16-304]